MESLGTFGEKKEESWSRQSFGLILGGVGVDPEVLAKLRALVWPEAAFHASGLTSMSVIITILWYTWLGFSFQKHALLSNHHRAEYNEMTTYHSNGPKDPYIRPVHMVRPLHEPRPSPKGK